MHLQLSAAYVNAPLVLEDNYSHCSCYQSVAFDSLDPHTITNALYRALSYADVSGSHYDDRNPWEKTFRIAMVILLQV